MNVKAEAYQEYNQAAVIDKLITGMPEVVRALASPLANVDKITIVSTGNGDAAGMNKITGDIAKMAAQVPALFETLSGMPMSELLGKVRQIGDKTPKPDALPPNGEVACGSGGLAVPSGRTGVAPVPAIRQRIALRRRNMKKPSMQIGLGIALGAGIGTALGVAAGHVAVWLAVGIAIGVAIGSSFRGTNCAECEDVHEKHQARSQQPDS